MIQAPEELLTYVKQLAQEGPYRTKFRCLSLFRPKNNREDKKQNLANNVLQISAGTNCEENPQVTWPNSVLFFPGCIRFCNRISPLSHISVSLFAVNANF